MITIYAISMNDYMQEFILKDYPVWNVDNLSGMYTYNYVPCIGGMGTRHSCRYHVHFELTSTIYKWTIY